MARLPNPRPHPSLGSAVTQTLGQVIGALPDTRSGIVAFEADLAASGFTATPVPIDPAVMDATARHMASDDSAVVVPEGLSRYRLVRWHRKDE